MHHQAGGADALQLGAHGGQEGAQVADLGLPCGVLDDGGALGRHRRHEHVLGRPHAGELEGDVGAHQPVAAALQVAVLQVEHRSQLGQAPQVDVDRPGSEVVAARQ